MAPILGFILDMGNTQLVSNGGHGRAGPRRIYSGKGPKSDLGFFRPRGSKAMRSEPTVGTDALADQVPFELCQGGEHTEDHLPLAVVQSKLAPRCFEAEDFHARDVTTWRPAGGAILVLCGIQLSKIADQILTRVHVLRLLIARESLFEIVGAFFGERHSRSRLRHAGERLKLLNDP
jgi:hypothetical protein